MVSVLIAPDKFKGSLSAEDVSRALERGVLRGAPDARIRRLASAYGGEGSVDEQSLSGKLPVALARRARRHGTEVHAVVGRCTLPEGTTAAHFRSVQALTDLTDQDCAHDSTLSARLLTRCGQILADRWSGQGSTIPGG
ncbi:glycerate kinase [Streptomyces sp. NPDC050528]|uniref:glycerate kinase n=1 Tax=unclassified Streptomyces TaxID=2593676 RepID=UPI0037A06118